MAKMTSSTLDAENRDSVCLHRLAQPVAEMPLRTFWIALPLPPRELSPNARIHWATKAKAVKAYRSLVWGLCRERWSWHGEPMQRVSVRFEWHLIARYTMPDLDNLQASFKAGLDGIADAGVIANDSARVVVHTESGYVLLGKGAKEYVQVTLNEREV